MTKPVLCVCLCASINLV